MSIKCLIFSIFYGLIAWNLIISILVTFGLAFSLLDAYANVVLFYFVFEAALMILLVQIYLNCVSFCKGKKTQ